MKRSLLMPPILVLVACEQPAAMLLGQPDPEPTLPTPSLPPPPVTTGRGLSQCEPKQLWSSRAPGYGIAPTPPSFAPNGALIAWGNGIYLNDTSYFRQSNGDLVFINPMDVAARDRSWRIGVRGDGATGVWIETLVGQERLLSMGFAIADPQLVRVRLSPEGDRVFALLCSEAGGSSVEVSSLPDGRPIGSVTMTNPCDEMWTAYSARIHPLDATRALVATRSALHLVDVASGEVQSIPLAQPLDQAAVLSLEVDSQVETFAFITHDGVLRRFTIDGLRELEAPRRVPVVTLNHNIYAPLVFASPIAWSKDGRLFASLDEDKSLRLEDPLTGRIHARIAPTQREPVFDDDTVEPVIAAAFNDDDTLLAVGYEHSFALYGCEPLETELEADAIPVRLDGPAVTAAGQPVEIVATAHSGEQVHGYQFFVDGEKKGPATADRTFRFTPDTFGSNRIEVLVDDGKRQGRASRSIMVQ